LVKIAEEAAKTNSVFGVNDRVGLVYDVLALSKAGLAPLSSALTVVDKLKDEPECALGEVPFLVSMFTLSFSRSGLGWYR
jgi:hypothetical protein